MLLYYCLHIHEHPALALALNTLVSMSHSGHLTLMEDVLHRSPGDCIKYNRAKVYKQHTL